MDGVAACAHDADVIPVVNGEQRGARLQIEQFAVARIAQRDAGFRHEHDARAQRITVGDALARAGHQLLASAKNDRLQALRLHDFAVRVERKAREVTQCDLRLVRELGDADEGEQDGRGCGGPTTPAEALDLRHDNTLERRGIGRVVERVEAVAALVGNRLRLGVTEEILDQLVVVQIQGHLGIAGLGVGRQSFLDVQPLFVRYLPIGVT